MIAFKALLLVLSTACAVLGAPAPKSTVVGGNGTISGDARPVKLAGPGIFVTTEENWAGPSLHIVNIVKGQCYTFAATWQNVISSFGPDISLQCYGYQQSDCQPPHPNFGPFFFPGISTHAGWDQDDINYDNRVNSFICYEGFPAPTSISVGPSTPIPSTFTSFTTATFTSITTATFTSITTATSSTPTLTNPWG